jgi:hypothetical protein
MPADQPERGRGRWRMLRHSGEFPNGSIVEAADQLVARLGLPRTATWNDLQAAVEDIYRKPIFLVASNSSSLRAITGLWIDTPDFGAIVCRERDDLHFQSQNACHELAHILFAFAPDEWFNELLPQYDKARGQQLRATRLCPPIWGPESPESQNEIAVEEVAFAMTRRIQSINRTAEEAYFG